MASQDAQRNLPLLSWQEHESWEDMVRKKMQEMEELQWYPRFQQIFNAYVDIETPASIVAQQESQRQKRRKFREISK